MILSRLLFSGVVALSLAGCGTMRPASTVCGIDDSPPVAGSQSIIDPLGADAPTMGMSLDEADAVSYTHLTLPTILLV